MSSPTTTVATPTITPIPIAQLLPWAAFALLIGALLAYFVGVEGGVSSLVNGPFMHELTHDGRHLLGFPCH
jgi:cobalt transporter subunit CbtB